MECRTCNARATRNRTTRVRQGLQYRQTSCGTVTVQPDDSNGGNGGNGGCTSDSDCGAGEMCDGGTCVPMDTGGGLPMGMILILAVAVGGFVVLR